MLVTFVESASVSQLALSSKRTFKNLFKKYTNAKKSPGPVCAQEISTEVYIFSIHDKNYTF